MRVDMDESTIVDLYRGVPNLGEHGCYSTQPTCLKIGHPIISIGSKPKHVQVHRKNE